jgi:hypothetical protein
MSFSSHFLRIASSMISGFQEVDWIFGSIALCSDFVLCVVVLLIIIILTVSKRIF